jgi:site-specific DNA-methyltransferase (cytosine-N4-specific)
MPEMSNGAVPKVFHKTRAGAIYLGDSLRVLEDSVKPGSVDLIVTSPPFGLVRKKTYGNVDADKYVDWFRPFCTAPPIFGQVVTRF